MPPAIFYTTSVLACGYMLVWIVIYCFPVALPFTDVSMNYTSVMVGGCTILLTGWYLYIRNRGYKGPRALVEEAERRLAQGEAVIAGNNRVSVEKI